MGQDALFDEYRPPLHVLCGRLLIVALVPGVIGMASEHWLAAPAGWSGAGQGLLHSGASGHVRHLGLWSVCSNFSRCASLPSIDFPDAFAPVRGLGVTSLCLHVLCVVVGLACSCEDPDNLMGVNVHVPRLEEFLAVLAGILMGGALGIFVQASHQHPMYQAFHLGWSYWVLLAYVCSLLLAGGVIVLVRYQRACRKRCACCCSRHHHQQTTLCGLGKGKHRPVRTTSFDLPTSDHHPIERHLKFFVEPYEKGTAFLGSAGLGKTSGGDDGNLLFKGMKGFPCMYSSLEGIPRMLQQLSDKPEETREG